MSHVDHCSVQDGCPREFKPAAGYEAVDPTATLVLERVGKHELRLSPWRVSCLKSNEIEAIVAGYGTRLGACLMVSQYSVDQNLLEFTKVRTKFHDISAFVQSV
jgi:hypothetical protein